MGEEKRDHRYSSDFVIVKKTGEFYIIEVKAENKRGDKTTEAQKRQWSSCRRQCLFMHQGRSEFSMRGKT